MRELRLVSSPLRNHVWASSYLAAIRGTLVKSLAVAPWHIPLTSHYIIDMLAEGRSLGAGLARAKTKFTIGHKILKDMPWANIFPMMAVGTYCPLLNLFQLTESRWEHKTADRISCLNISDSALQVCSMAINTFTHHFRLLHEDLTTDGKPASNINISLLKR